MGAKRKRFKILLQSESWTAIRHDVFNDVLPKLSPSAQILYLALFDHIWHIPRRRIFACEADMVRWTGLDQRTVSRCLNELLNETEVICCEHLGKKNSRTDKPRWTVPLTQFELDEGYWVPIPRFLIHKYLPAYPRAILLVILLWHQHMSWLNECWPGAPRLALLTGWSRRKVYDALCKLNNENVWHKCCPDLPWPLEITFRPNKHGGKSRHYRVRAVVYEPKKGRGFTTYRLSEQFAEFFGVKKAVKPTALEFDEEAS
jgi:hypothetical protein